MDTLYINVCQNGKMFTKVREECLAAGMDFLGDGEAGRVTTAGRLIETTTKSIHAIKISLIKITLAMNIAILETNQNTEKYVLKYKHICKGRSDTNSLPKDVEYQIKVMLKSQYCSLTLASISKIVWC